MQSFAFKEILICDDHAFSRLGLEMALRELNGNVRLKHVKSAEEALQEIHLQTPEMAFIDVGLPGMSGVDLAKELRDKFPKLKVVVVTGSDHPETFRQLQKIKVAAIVRKGSEPEELKHILQQLNVDSEETLLDRSVQLMLKKDEMMALTAREYEVLELIVQGLPNREIAQRLNCALTTVRSHRASVMDKTGIRNAAELTAWFLNGQRKAN